MAQRPGDSFRTHKLIVDIIIYWELMSVTSILPAAWAPRLSEPGYFLTFLDLLTCPAIATKHPFRWTQKFAEEMRRLAHDSVGKHEEAVKLLVQTAQERCKNLDAVAEIMTADVKRTLEMWRAGLRAGPEVELGTEGCVAASLRAGRRLTWEEYGSEGVFEEEEEAVQEMEVEMEEEKDPKGDEMGSGRVIELPLR